MTEVATQENLNGLDVTDGIKGQEFTNLKDALKDDKTRQEIISKMVEELKNKDPNHVKKELEDSIGTLSDSLSNEEFTKVVNAYNLLFGGEPQNTIESKDAIDMKQELASRFQELNLNKLATLSDRIGPEKTLLILNIMHQTNELTVNSIQGSNEADTKFQQIIENTNIDPNSQTKEDLDQYFGDFKRIKEIVQTGAKIDFSDTNEMQSQVSQLAEKVGLSEEEANMLVEGIKEIAVVEKTEKTEAPTVDNVLGIELKDLILDGKKLEIDGKKAAEIQMQMESTGVRAFIDSAGEVSEKNKIAVVNAFLNDTFYGATLDNEEHKQFKELLLGDDPQAITDFLEKQDSETIKTYELLSEKLKGKEQLVNSMDNAILNNLRKEFPNVPEDISRNMATAYTITMLEYVGSLPEEEQAQLVKDLTPEEGNTLLSVPLNLLKKFSTNESVRGYFKKYDSINTELKGIINTEGGPKTEEEFAKYSIFADPRKLVETFRTYDSNKGLDQELVKAKENSQIPDKLATSLTDFINKKGSDGKEISALHKLDAKTLKAMDDMAAQLNGTGHEIAGIKNMLEDPSMANTLNQLASIPFIGPFLKGLMDMGMKLLGYENGFDGYMDKMNEEALAEFNDYFDDLLTFTETKANTEEEKAAMSKKMELSKTLKESELFKDKTTGVGENKTEFDKGLFTGLEAAGIEFGNKEEVVNFLSYKGKEGPKLKEFIEEGKAIENKWESPESEKNKIFSNLDAGDTIDLGKLSVALQLYGDCETAHNQSPEKKDRKVFLAEKMKNIEKATTEIADKKGEEKGKEVKSENSEQKLAEDTGKKPTEETPVQTEGVANTTQTKEQKEAA